MNQNYTNTGLIPPVNASDGFAGQPDKSLSEILTEEASLVRQSALKDAVTYLVDNAVNNADHNVRSAINIRYNMKWAEVDRLISKAQTLVGPEIEKAKAERDKSEQQRIEYISLSALFIALGLQIQTSEGGYTLSGLTESQLSVCVAVLAKHEGIE